MLTRMLTTTWILVGMHFIVSTANGQITKTHTYDGKVYTLQENGFPGSYMGDLWECIAGAGFGIVQADYYTGLVPGATPGTYTDTVDFIGWHSDSQGTQSMVLHVTSGTTATADRFYPSPHWNVGDAVSEAAFEEVYMHDQSFVRWRVDEGDYAGEEWDQNVMNDSSIYSPTGGGAFFDVGGMYATAIQDYLVTNVDGE